MMGAQGIGVNGYTDSLGVFLSPWLYNYHEPLCFSFSFFLTLFLEEKGYTKYGLVQDTKTPPLG